MFVFSCISFDNWTDILNIIFNETEFVLIRRGGGGGGGGVRFFDKSCPIWMVC